MVELRSRLARLSVAGAGIALIGPGLMLSTAGSAHAQTRAGVTASASCATASGVTGSATQRGTDYIKQNDGCPNLALRWAQGTGHFGGFYKDNGVWILGTRGYVACSGSCDALLLSDVDSGTELTVNNKTAGDGGDPIQVGF